MAVERRKQTLLLNHLYKVVEDPYTGSVSLTSFDVHYEADSVGDDTEYTK